MAHVGKIQTPAIMWVIAGAVDELWRSLTASPSAVRMTREQRFRLIELLVTELTHAWVTAIAAGADPRMLAAAVERRRAALQASINPPL